MKFNAIYGSFAVLPLLLIWMQYSWYIVLFGAELAFANQNVENYELENEINSISNRFKKVISILVCKNIIDKFRNGTKPSNALDIATELDLPVRLVRSVINELVTVNILSEVKTNEEKDPAYQPALNDDQLSVRYVIDKIDENGLNQLPLSKKEEIEKLQKLFVKLEKVLDNDIGNTLIRNIS